MEILHAEKATQFRVNVELGIFCPLAVTVIVDEYGPSCCPTEEHGGAHDLNDMSSDFPEDRDLTD